MKQFSNQIIILACLLFISAIPLSAAGIIVAPNPWIPESQKTATGNLTDGISFINLPEQGEIFIYTISGELVRRIQFTSTSAGTARWLGKNEENEYVASGVYLWVMQSPDLTKTGKLIVIR